MSVNLADYFWTAPKWSEVKNAKTGEIERKPNSPCRLWHPAFAKSGSKTIVVDIRAWEGLVGLAREVGPEVLIDHIDTVCKQSRANRAAFAAATKAVGLVGQSLAEMRKVVSPEDFLKAGPPKSTKTEGKTSKK
jgi:hypothetical protein